MADRSDIAQRRLRSNHLIGDPFERARDVVEWFGAVQSQDFDGARWGLAQRLRGATAASLEAAFNRGEILRTHTLRPTWHFVSPRDIRWIVALTASRVHALNGFSYRRLGLAASDFARSERVLARELQGGAYLTRPEVATLFRKSGLDSTGLRWAYLVMHAELESVICSGPRRGKQYTYALLDERAASGKTLARDAALATLTRRYFTGHGPAQAIDFQWWSSLSAADVRAGLSMAAADLEQEVINGKTYWSGNVPIAAHARPPVLRLLPNFDEFLVAHRDRSAHFEGPLLGGSPISTTGMFHTVVLDGRVIGGWRRNLQGNRLAVTVRLIVGLNAKQRSALESQFDRYRRYLEQPVTFAVRRA